jgi:molybdopterin-guanine dinucleotide biosynthesis protein A
MGADKALLVAMSSGPGAGPGGDTLAARTARLLAQVAGPCLEVGPGVSGLAALREEPAGAGPLVAVAAGGQALAAAGWAGPVLVVATDLPVLSVAVLEWLAEHRAFGSVVPIAGSPQPLCARWSAADLDLAVDLVAGGARAMSDLVAAAAPTLAGADDPGGPGSAALADADTPDDARRLGLKFAPRPDPPGGAGLTGRLHIGNR